MEVGRSPATSSATSRRQEFKEQVDGLLKALDAAGGDVRRSAVPPARLEAQWAANKQKYFFDKLIANIKAATRRRPTEKWDPSTWPSEVKGVGFPKRRAGRLATGSRSRTAGSTTTSAWCPPPGTAAAR
jgi:Ni,Fe-hydrogenase I large subunit